MRKSPSRMLPLTVDPGILYLIYSRNPLNLPFTPQSKLQYSTQNLVVKFSGSSISIIMAISTSITYNLARAENSDARLYWDLV